MTPLSRSLRVFRGPIARAATGSLALRLLFLGSGLVQSVLLARLAGPEGYGLFAILHAIAMLAAWLCVFGLDKVAVRELARARLGADWPRIRGLLRTTQRLTLGLATFGAAMVLTAGALIPAGTRWGAGPLLAVAALIIVLALLHLLQGISQGLGSIVRAQLPLNLVRSATFVVLLALAGLVQGQISGGTALVLSAIASTAALAFAYRLLGQELAGRAAARRPEPWRPLLREGIPFTLNSFLIYLTAELVTLVIGALSSTEEAGLFQPVARLSNVIATAQFALAMPLAPKIAELWSGGDRGAIEALVRRSARAALLVTSATAVPVALASPLVLSTFGAEFTRVGASVYVVALAQMTAAALGAPHLVLNMTGHARFSVAGPLLSILSILVLAPLLIPAMGVLGGTLAMAAGLLVNRVTVSMLVRRQVGVVSWV